MAFCRQYSVGLTDIIARSNSEVFETKGHLSLSVGLPIIPTLARAGGGVPRTTDKTAHVLSQDLVTAGAKMAPLWGGQIALDRIPAGRLRLAALALNTGKNEKPLQALSKRIVFEPNFQIRWAPDARVM